MSDPNLPEGVKQSDIDAAVGETFDPNLCLHEEIKCDNCEETMLELGNRAVEEKNRQIENMKTRLQNIKFLCENLYGHHPPTCAGWDTYRYRIIFQSNCCNCPISDILHQIEMAEPPGEENENSESRI